MSIGTTTTCWKIYLITKNTLLSTLIVFIWHLDFLQSMLTLNHLLLPQDRVGTNTVFMLRKWPWSSFRSSPICLTWTDNIHLFPACLPRLGRLFVSEDSALGSPGNIPHPIQIHTQTTVDAIVVFLCVRKRVCGWTTTTDTVSRPSSSSCHFFDLLSKLSWKTEQLIGNQAQQFSPSLLATANCLSSSSFQILFVLFPRAAASTTMTDLTNADSRAYFLLWLFFLSGMTDTPPLSLAQIPLYCCIILQSVVSNDSQASIICKYRLCRRITAFMLIISWLLVCAVYNYKTLQFCFFYWALNQTAIAFSAKNPPQNPYCNP